MEVNSCDEGLDTKFASSRCKAKKAVLNRRPSGYWKVFSNWWRGRYAALKTRPTVHEVIEWYHRNAASSWPAGQVPCLKAVLRQSKGLRPIDGLKEYFREYRKKRKQQGGLALKACEDASGRARPAKRRRGRAAQRDSSDEDEAYELENEASGLSDQAASEDEAADAEDGGVAQDEPMPTEPEAAAAPACSGRAQDSDKQGRDVSAAHAVFESWQQAGAGPSGVPADPPAASSVPANMLLDGEAVADVIGAPDLCFMSLPSGSAVDDLLHPSAVPGLVPVSPSGASDDLRAVEHAMLFSGRPAPPPSYVFIPAVPVANAPPKPAPSRFASGIISLPPLSSVAAAGVAQAGMLPSHQRLGDTAPPGANHQGDDQADDRCSTGGGVPPGGHGYARPYFHDRMMEGYGYPAMYGAPLHMYYPGHPHHACCYPPRQDLCPAPYPYRAVPATTPFQLAQECSSGGAGVGSTSSFSPAKPWSRPPTDGGMHAFPQRQPSVESPAQMDPRYPHQWPPAPCGGWGMCGMDSTWQGHPMYSSDPGACGCSGRHPHAAPRAFCTAGPGCPCGLRPEAAMYYGRVGALMLPRGPCPMYMHPGAEYAGRVGHPLYSACADGRKASPIGAQPAAKEKPAGAGEGEACSTSSISEQQQAPSDALPCNPQDQGRRSPCSGVSAVCQPPQQAPRHPPRPPHHFMPAMGMPFGQHYPMGFYPPYMCGPRGMASAGSATSIPSLAAMPGVEGSVFTTTAAVRSTAPVRAGLPAPFGPQQAREHGKPMSDAVDMSTAADADVAPYFNDAPAPRTASDVGAERASERAAPPGRGDQAGLGLEAVDCGLGVEDGLGAAARESLDQDLAFAWENFVACDSSFESTIACH